MNLIFIIGPPASGKMTVGQALKKLTGYKLFYNHLSLELVNQFFDFGTPNFSSLDKKHEADWRMNTLNGEYVENKIFKIDNSQLAANEVAMQILTHFKLPLKNGLNS